MLYVFNAVSILAVFIMTHYCVVETFSYEDSIEETFFS